MSGPSSNGFERNADVRLDWSFLRKAAVFFASIRTGKNVLVDRRGKDQLHNYKNDSLLDVSRSGYYNWVAAQAAGPSPTRSAEGALDAKVALFTRRPLTCTGHREPSRTCGKTTKPYPGRPSPHR